MLTHFRNEEILWLQFTKGTVQSMKNKRNSKEKEKGYSFLSFAQLKQLSAQDGFCVSFPHDQKFNGPNILKFFFI